MRRIHVLFLAIALGSLATSTAGAQPADEAPDPHAGKTGLTIHFITNRQTYAGIEYDVFSLETGKVVGSGKGAIESRGEESQVWELPPGLYKIVKHGEPMATR